MSGIDTLQGFFQETGGFKRKFEVIPHGARQEESTHCIHSDGTIYPRLGDAFSQIPVLLRLLEATA